MNVETYESKYIFAFKRVGQSFGICFFDVTTLQIYIGEFVDDENMSSFRTLVSQV